jgi:trehalose 6-phosphate synthase
MAKTRTKSDFVVVANRLPVRMVRGTTGIRWETSPGGLVSALGSVLSKAERASWVGWSGLPGDSEAPFEHDGMQLVPVPLSRREMASYYEGFSNGSIWPLYHDAIVAPEFHRTWWESYVEINRRFAEHTASVAGKGAIVWIHDYHLQLMPAMLRAVRPDLRIGFFLHIPFPARELFLRLPWRRQIAEGLLGADVIGFQTTVTAHNFLYVAPRVTDAYTSGKTVYFENRKIQVDTFPVGIDAERFALQGALPATQDRVAELRALLGNPRTVILGVDRLDYTKGIELRLRAFEELLEDGRLDSSETVMVQIAEPSRENVLGYSTVRDEVERLVGSINGIFSEFGHEVVHYQHQSVDFGELVALFRLADVMLLTPFRDGMNLVAKEYVASRGKTGGVLVLSEFAGSSFQLRQALLVNPYDITAVKDAIEEAVSLPMDVQRRRMRAMERIVRRTDADQWANSFLERLR